MISERSAYMAHHPLVKHAASLKDLFTTLKAKSPLQQAMDYAKSPAVLTGTAAGLAGGAYFGNKAFQEKEDAPAAKVLPRIEEPSYIYPANKV